MDLIVYVGIEFFPLVHLFVKRPELDKFENLIFIPCYCVFPVVACVDFALNLINA